MNKLLDKIKECAGRTYEEASSKNFRTDFFDRLAAAWIFITRIPLPAKWYPTRMPPGDKVLAVMPLTGAVLGFLTGMSVYLLRWLGLSSYPSVWLGAALYSFCGWALHLDGWGDLWDGVGSGKSGEELLSVIKDSSLGAYGTIGLILALGLWTSLAAAVPVQKIVAATTVAAAAARFAACSCAFFGRYPWDSGLAKGWVDKFDENDLFFSFLCTLVFLPLAPIAWFFSVIIAFLTGFGLARRMNSRLGGANGDVLGAAAVAAEIFALAVFAICQ